MSGLKRWASSRILSQASSARRLGSRAIHGPLDAADFEHLPGVAEAIRVSKAYKLVSRETKRENTVVTVNGVRVGGEDLVLCGGPCSVESREQILESARAVKAAGGELLRGRRLQAPNLAVQFSRTRGRRVCGTWPMRERRQGSESSLKRSMSRRSIWWSSTPIAFRLEREACRIFHCCGGRADRASQYY